MKDLIEQLFKEIFKAIFGEVLKNNPEFKFYFYVVLASGMYLFLVIAFFMTRNDYIKTRKSNDYKCPNCQNTLNAIVTKINDRIMSNIHIFIIFYVPLYYTILYLQDGNKEVDFLSLLTIFGLPLFPIFYYQLAVKKFHDTKCKYCGHISNKTEVDELNIQQRKH